MADELAEARVLAERGEAKAALGLLERVRREAFDTERLSELERVLVLTVLIYRQTEGKRHSEAGRLGFQTQQNIRSLGRKLALAEGREWVDPFAPPAGGSTVASGRTSGTAPVESPRRDRWGERPWAPWAFGVWLLVIAGTAAAMGTINSAPGYVIPGSTWAVEAALAGLSFGFLAGVFMPRAPWRGDACVVSLAGSVLYSLAYEVAAAVGHGGGSAGGAGLVFIVVTVTCAVPMIIAATLGYTLQAALLPVTRLFR